MNALTHSLTTTHSFTHFKTRSVSLASLFSTTLCVVVFHLNKSYFSTNFFHLPVLQSLKPPPDIFFTLYISRRWGAESKLNLLRLIVKVSCFLWGFFCVKKCANNKVRAYSYAYQRQCLCYFVWQHCNLSFKKVPCLRNQ